MTVRQRLAAIVEILRWMAAGAWLVTFYLDTVLDPAEPLVHRLFYIAMFSFWGLWLLESWLKPKPVPQLPLPDVSAAHGGAGVVVATGMAAAWYLGRDLHRPHDAILPGLILLSTAGIAVAVVRFARRHAGEIGEARFDTRSRDAR